jgi:hypothetical protein
MKCSDLIESASAIFAARAGRCSRIKIYRSNGQPGDARPGDSFWLAEKVFAAVASLCDLIFARGRGALCGLAKARVQLAFPYRCLLFLLSFFLLLQIEKQKRYSRAGAGERARVSDTGVTAFIG